MSQADQAHAFAALHVKGAPLVLYNCWDAGSAAAVADSGAAALATGSWSVASAQGHADGEALPMEALLAVVRRICATQDLPLSVDFEGGYAVAPEDLRYNAAALIEAGAVGCNFEDRIVAAGGLYPVAQQAARIAALRAAAEDARLPFFINARTDLFISTPPEDHSGLLDAAIDRAEAYAAAGASGFFVPMLTDADLIARLCAAVTLPVNVMMHETLPDREWLCRAGVARISHGPAPYMAAMVGVTAAARAALG